MGDMPRLKLLTAVSYLVDANILTSFLRHPLTTRWQNIGEWTLIPGPSYSEPVTAHTGQGQLKGRCRDYVLCFVSPDRNLNWRHEFLWWCHVKLLYQFAEGSVILRWRRIWPIKVMGIVAGKCWCLTFDYSKLCGIVFPKIFEFASEDRTVQCLSDQSEGLRKRHAILTKINKISDVLSLILDPVMFYPCHNILSEQSNKEAVPAMMPKKYED